MPGISKHLYIITFILILAILIFGVFFFFIKIYTRA